MMQSSILTELVIYPTSYRFPLSNPIDSFELPNHDEPYIFRINDEGMNDCVVDTSRKFSWDGDECWIFSGC